MADKTVWTLEDMIEAALEWWGDDNIAAEDCEVRQTTDGRGERCLVVVDKASGKTSAEAGDDGRWHLDGTAYGD